jgi:hypothetical protein
VVHTVQLKQHVPWPTSSLIPTNIIIILFGRFFNMAQTPAPVNLFEGVFVCQAAIAAASDAKPNAKPASHGSRGRGRFCVPLDTYPRAFLSNLSQLPPLKISRRSQKISRQEVHMEKMTKLNLSLQKEKMHGDIELDKWRREATR